MGKPLNTFFYTFIDIQLLLVVDMAKINFDYTFSPLTGLLNYYPVHTYYWI